MLDFHQAEYSICSEYIMSFMLSLTDIHYASVKRILRYLQQTLHKRLFFKYGAATPFVTAFSDVDWAGDINKRRSTTDFVVLMGNCLVLWQSKEQGYVVRSSR